MKRLLFIIAFFAFFANISAQVSPPDTLTAKKVLGSMMWVRYNGTSWDTLGIYPDSIPMIYSSSGKVLVDTLVFRSDSSKIFTHALGSDTGYVSTTGDNMYGTYYLNGVPIKADSSLTFGYGFSIGGGTPTSGTVSIGENAGGGYYSTAIGSFSLNSATGSYNNAIGFNSLYSNTTGTYNQAFGYNALSDNTTGSNNIAIGHLSLTDNTTGTSNIGIGYWAALEQRAGTWNIAIGDQAMKNDTGGSDNIAIGYKAMEGSLGANSTGNIVIGSQALNQNSEGNYNVAIGYRALYSNEYNGNVALGHAAGFNATDSNRLYIDNSDTTAALITGDFDENTITINGELKVTVATHLFAFFGDSTVTFNYAVADTWYHVSNATDSLFRYQEKDGFTVSNDTITILEAGDYDLLAIMNFEGGNAKTYAFRFYNVTTGQGIPVAGGVNAEGAADVVQVVTSSYLRNGSAGDKIVFQTKQDDTDPATFKSSSIKIYKVHE